MISRRIIDIGRARLAVTEAGHGAVVLFVHGFPLDARMWFDQMNMPGDPGRLLAALDLRGHGSSPWVGDESHDMDVLAEDLAALVSALGVTSVDLVALSMGGYVALALMERHPHLVRSLALVDTRSGPDTEQARAGRNAMIDQVLLEGRSSLASTLVPKLVGPSASATVRARMRTMIEEQPVESIVADLRGIRDRPDRGAVLSTISVPVSVIVGEDDAITPPSDSEAMAKQIPEAELVIVRGAGHMSPMEAPGAVAQALRDLWARAG